MVFLAVIHKCTIIGCWRIQDPRFGQVATWVTIVKPPRDGGTTEQERIDPVTSWRQALISIANDVESLFDNLRYGLADRLGEPGKIQIIAYNGYGSRSRLRFTGRVLEDKGVTPALDNDSLWRNLLNTYRRMESDEIRFARLRVRYQDYVAEVSADEEGFFEVEVPVTRPLDPGRLWETVDLELISPKPSKQDGPVTARAEVLVPPANARFVVISDIDDTIVQTDATHLIKMARNVFMGNARTRLPFPGVAGLYRALFAGSSGEEWNPLFYVSSSPWNLYDLLVDFFRLQNIPIGPVLFLRNWGINYNEILPVRNSEYKISVIRQLLNFYEDLPFILIGDSGQEDPEIYASVVKEFPNRILATYIRNVSRKLSRTEEINNLAREMIDAGATLILADNTVEIAEHALEMGWIHPDRMPEILGEKDKDEAPPSPLEKVLGQDLDEPPTAVVEPEGRRETEELKQAIDEGALDDMVKDAGKDQSDRPPTVRIDPKHGHEDQDK